MHPCSSPIMLHAHTDLRLQTHAYMRIHINPCRSIICILFGLCYSLAFRPILVLVLVSGSMHIPYLDLTFALNLSYSSLTPARSNCFESRPTVETTAHTRTATIHARTHALQPCTHTHACYTPAHSHSHMRHLSVCAAI